MGRRLGQQLYVVRVEPKLPLNNAGAPELEIEGISPNVTSQGPLFDTSGREASMEVRVAFLALSVAFAIAVIGATITTTRSVETKQTPTHVILSGPISRT